MLAEAEALLEAHPLRTLDAVHVASARLFQKRMRVPVLFVTSDARQLTAGAREAIRVTREKVEVRGLWANGAISRVR